MPEPTDQQPAGDVPPGGTCTYENQNGIYKLIDDKAVPPKWCPDDLGPCTVPIS